MRKRSICLVLVLLLALSASPGLAHPGRTDANGGHHNRKTGGYHYHNSGKSSSRTPAKKTTPSSKVTPTNMPKTMTTGQTIQLGWDSENTSSVAWKSGSPKKLVVSEKGELTAIAPGEVKVTATMDTGSKSFTVQVKPKRVESIEILNKPLVIPVDSQIRLNVELTPSDAYELGVKWTSSDQKILSVAKDGTLTNLGTGKARITATAADNPKMKDSVDVFVGNPCETVQINAPETATSGEKIPLSVEIAPEHATDKRVTWELTPKSAGEISAKGIVTFKKVKEPTEVLIRCTTKDIGLSAEHTLIVLPAQKDL